MRLLFAVNLWTVLFFVFCFLGLKFITTPYGLLLGIAAWFAALAYGHKFFLVSVPEVTGLVTINLITGNLHPYRTGVHFRYLWEQVKEGNYINMRIITKSHEENYPSKDGPLMHVKWSFQYKPPIRSLPQYIAVDETTIEKGLIDVGSSFLSADIAQKEAIKCKDEQEELENGLKKAFESAKVVDKDGNEKKLEEFYGIDLVRVSLADVDYEEKFQRVRASEQVANRIKEIAKKIREEHPEISQKDAMNTALIINKDVTKHVQEVEGEGGKALAGLLMAMSTGGKSPEGGKK